MLLKATPYTIPASPSSYSYQKDERAISGNLI